MKSQNGPNDCTIDCQATYTDCHRGLIFTEAENADAILQGFTIVNAFSDKGAGVYCVDSSPRIKNCILENNAAAYQGGAMQTETLDTSGHCAPVFDDCIFRANSAAYGGAVCNINADSVFNNCHFTDNSTSLDGGATNDAGNMPTYNTCTFSRNSAQGGGAMWLFKGADAMLVNCLFTGNSTRGHSGAGGAIYVYSSSPKITGCVFTFNLAQHISPTSGARGGAICNWDNRRDAPIISDCYFAGNSATLGGAIYSWFNANIVIQNSHFTGNSAEDEGGAVRIEGPATISNCVIAGNVALKGAGVFASERADHSIENCLFYANVAREDGGGLYYVAVAPGLHLKNCILWGNFPQQIYTSDSPAIVTHSDIQDAWPGEGNIDADPCFADPGYWDANETPEDANDDFWVDGDYHLKSQAGRWHGDSWQWIIDDVMSPCIDAGDPMSPVGHEQFPNGGIVNMGAYGGTGEASKSYFGKPPCETIVTGDINGDCEINFDDFRLMALHWCE